MGRRRRFETAAVAFVVGVMATATACGDDGAEVTAAEREAGVYEVVLRDLVLPDLPLRGADDPLPIVYVLGADGTTVPADVQARVVKTFVDDAEVRFVDAREDAVLADGEADHAGEPVRDGGLLVTFGAMPATGTTLHVDVELYRAIDDDRGYVVTLAGGPARWLIRSKDPTG
jgi:hypothetical protein